MRVTPEGGAAPGVAAKLFAPLERFYRKSGIALPEIKFVDGELVPEPAKRLLVHAGDMTSRLRKHHGAEIGLRCVSVAYDEESMWRLVVLFRSDTGAPVEFGAIRIFLGVLDEDVRDLVVAGKEPLGGILERCGVDYTSGPKGYFRYGADAFVGILLDETVEKPLFGRCNELAMRQSGEVFAEIVEILPEGVE